MEGSDDGVVVKKRYPCSETNVRNLWCAEHIGGLTRMVLINGGRLAPAAPFCLREPQQGEPQNVWRSHMIAKQALCREGHPAAEWATSVIPLHEAANAINVSITATARGMTSVNGYKFNDCNTILQTYKQLGNSGGGIFAQDTCAQLSEFILSDDWICKELGMRKGAGIAAMSCDDVRSILQIAASVRTERENGDDHPQHRGLNRALYHTRIWDSQGMPIYGYTVPHQRKRNLGLMDCALNDLSAPEVLSEIEKRASASGSGALIDMIPGLREHLVMVCTELPAAVSPIAYGISCQVFENELGVSKVGPALHGLPVGNMPRESPPARLMNGQYNNYFAHVRAKMDCTSQIKCLSSAYAQCLFNHMKSKMDKKEWKRLTKGVSAADQMLYTHVQRGVDAIHKVFTEHPYGVCMQTKYGRVDERLEDVWQNGVDLTWAKGMIAQSARTNFEKRQRRAGGESPEAAPKDGWITKVAPESEADAGDGAPRKSYVPTWQRKWTHRGARNAVPVPKWLQLALDTMDDA